MLFVVFLLAYLVALPVILLRVLGYELHPFQGGRVVENGGIFLATDPLGATITVAGIHYSHATPLAIVPLEPGRYPVRLELAGYRPWEATVQVKPGLVTDVGSVLLLPAKLAPEPVSPLAFSSLIPTGVRSFILLQRGRLMRQLYLCDTQTGDIVPVVGPASPLADLPVQSVWSEPGGSSFLLRLAGRALFATIHWPRVDFADLTALGFDGVTRAEWAAADPANVFLQRGDGVDWVNVAAETVQRGFVREVHGFGPSGSSLYVMDRAAGVQRVDLATGARTPVDPSPALPAWLAADGFVRLAPLSPQFLVAHAADGAFVATIGPARFSLSGVRGFVADSVAGIVLAWQQRRAALADLSAGFGSQGPAHSLPAGEQWWAVDRAADIRQAFLVYGNSYVLYRDGATVMLVGPREAPGRTPEEVVKVRAGTEVSYSDGDGRLYFLDAATATLSWVRIVAREPAVRELLLGLRR